MHEPSDKLMDPTIEKGCIVRQIRENMACVSWQVSGLWGFQHDVVIDGNGQNASLIAIEAVAVTSDTFHKGTVGSEGAERAGNHPRTPCTSEGRTDGDEGDDGQKIGGLERDPRENATQAVTHDHQLSPAGGVSFQFTLKANRQPVRMDERRIFEGGEGLDLGLEVGAKTEELGSMAPHSGNEDRGSSDVFSTFPSDTSPARQQKPRVEICGGFASEERPTH